MLKHVSKTILIRLSVLTVLAVVYGFVAAGQVSQSEPATSTPLVEQEASTDTATPAKPIYTVVNPTKQAAAATPAPDFRIDLHSAATFAQTNPSDPTTKYAQVPYDVLYNAGFGNVSGAQATCKVITAPVVSSNVLCSVSQTNARAGTLSIQYNDASVAGYYQIQMAVTVNNMTRAATFDFDLNR